MAVKSSFVNMVVCLTAVCLVCSALLAGVYSLTYDPIEQANIKALQIAVGKVLPEGGSLSEAKTGEFNGVSYEYYEQQGDSTVIAYAVKSVSIGFGGPLSVMVGVLPDGTVYNTSVLSHSETPGLGAKCNTDEAFMAQWKGFNGKFAVKKDGGDVDAITASTITSRAYTVAVAQAVNFVKSFVGEEPVDTDAVSGASTVNTEEE